MACPLLRTGRKGAVGLIVALGSWGLVVSAWFGTPSAATAAPPDNAAGAATGNPAGDVYPIDLPTALRLANAENLQIALAREQIRQAWAQLDRAQVLWLPSLRAGMNYDKHEGFVQRGSTGVMTEVSRDCFYAGAGAGVVETGTPAVPGVYANFQMADAIFQPLAARQAVGAQQWAATAVTNDILLQVSQSYSKLLQAAGDVVIALDAQRDAEELAVLTKNYASSGQGLQSDADRARTELAIRRNDVIRAQETLGVVSTRLAELLRLDPRVKLAPSDPSVVPLELVKLNSPVGDLISQGLTCRPELSEARYLVGVAVERMHREQCAILLPSVILGASYGDFAGGVGSGFDNSGGRLETDVIAFWEIRNLGLGERAARAEARSVLQQAHISQVAMMDRVARQVTEAQIQVVNRAREIPTLQEAVVSATASQKRNLQRIREVQGLPIEVIQSNQALALARSEHLRALSDYNSAQFQLYWAVGWPPRPADAAVMGIPDAR
jgi:outer membrane protein TolC